MARDIQDTVRTVLGSDSAKTLLGTAFNEALKGVGNRSNGGSPERNTHQPFSGMRGVAAGAGAAALAPMAAKGIGKLIRANGVEALAGGPKRLAEGAGSKLGDAVGDKVTGKIDDSGGPSGILKDTVKSALPFGGGGRGGKGKQDAEGVGKGRRMPVQQSFDIALPIETVYNQWTQFEEWPKFMHRVTRVTQEDPCKVSFTAKIWGRTREFTADIETQRPNDRIKWKTTDGISHTGVVMFRELGPNLTRVLLSFDVDPGGLVEKYARGARYVKRAARADMHRFVAFIEMLEHETGAWRGVIEEGELVEDHDPSYDEQREYGSAEDLIHGRGSDADEDSDEDEDDERERGGRRSSRNGSGGQSSGRRQGTRARSGSGTRQQRGSSAASGGATGSRSRSAGSSGGRSRSSGSSSSRRGSSASSSSRKASAGSGSGRRGSSTSARGRSSSSKGSSARSGSSSGSSRSRGSSGAKSGGQRTRSRRS